MSGVEGVRLFVGGVSGGVDDETTSTCPLLLTPSPTTSSDFQHPLAISTTPPPALLDYDHHQQSPSSVDTENSSCPVLASNNADFSQEPSSKDPSVESKGLCGIGEECVILEGSSSSSSCSALQESASSARLLNSRKYLNLATDTNCQENGGIKPSLVGLTLGKSAQEFGFTSWNWPLIRRFCFWSLASVTVACVCIIIGYITTIPNRCDPSKTWFQGALIYQVFPASFQDSDGNSVGDLRGLKARVNYLKGLGASGVRLSWIFPAAHYPEEFSSVENLTCVDPSIGSVGEVASLAAALHNLNMTLILDLPLHPFFNELKTREDLEDKTKKDQVQHVIVNNHILVSAVNKTRPDGWNGDRGIVTDIMAFWMDEGVDGFYLQGLEHFVNDDNFFSQVEEWRREKYRRRRLEGGFEKVLICSEQLLVALKEVTVLDAEAKTASVLSTFDLVEMRVDPFVNGTKSIEKRLSWVESGPLYSRPGSPWPFWSLGWAGGRRPASKASQGNLTLAAVILSMMLPGSTNLLYGDEIGLQDIHDPEGERSDLSEVHGLGPMHWETGGGFSKGGVLGWLPQAPHSIPPKLGVNIVAAASLLRSENPSIYMHALWSSGKLVPNTAIRYADNQLVTVERTYPRRNGFLFVGNLSPKSVTRDLSKLYYGGSIVVNTQGELGNYLSFQFLTLGPGHAIIAKLDK